MKQHVEPDWPYVKAYTGEDLRRIALPLGGIGTGTISIGGRGDLRDWEMMNTPAKGYTPVSPTLKNLGSFFAIIGFAKRPAHYTLPRGADRQQ